MTVAGIGTARGGFIYHPDGLDLASILADAAAGRPITQQPGVRVWPSTIDGLRATEADLLVEVTASPPADGEPGLTHMREALQRKIPVVTSNKWPVALHGAELAALAHRQQVAFRAESTVMSGTPVLSTLTEGLAGTAPSALRGVLNATANYILSQMADGTSYEDALAEAQHARLAEADPAADVEGHDTVAKVMILSALVFGRQLRREQVTCQGITGITGLQARQAASAGGRLRHVATLEFSGPDGTGTVTARVQPEAVPADDLLARIDGVTNALVCQASPVGEVTIIGPGAGPQPGGPGSAQRHHRSRATAFRELVNRDRRGAGPQALPAICGPPLAAATGGRPSVSLCGQCAGELAAGADAELGEYLPEVVGDGRRADEQLRGDLGIRGTLAGQAGDVRFPGGKHVPGLRGLLGGALASRAQLGSCPLGERPGAGRDEDLVRGAKLTAGIALALLTAQPLAVQQITASRGLESGVAGRRGWRAAARRRRR